VQADIPACLEAFETIRKPRSTLFSKTADEQSKLMVSKDPKEIENRDKLRKEKANLMPEGDGKAIDKVPSSSRDHMYAHWTYAYDVVDYVRLRCPFLRFC
jgi:salicylate hydroxylase